MQNFSEILETEQTLDPENWAAMKTLAHSMVDDMFNYFQQTRTRPVWQKTPQKVKENFQKNLPKKPSSPEEIYEDFKENILPYNKGNIHPRFFSWVEGGGTPLGMMAEMLAAGMNPNVAIGDHAAMYVDKQVVNWCKEIMNFPADASGVLVSGGSVANITALIAAMNSFQEGIIKKNGLQQLDNQLVIYCSTETHNCIIKAAEVIGIGYENVRNIAVNDDYCINIEALKQAIEADKKVGNLPFCLVGNAGTVNTGAIDDLDELLKIAKKENIWFHVDGAFGALAKLTPEFSEKLKAIEKADSVAFDLHKWLYMPYEIGCVLVRDSKKHRAAFVQAKTANYLMSHERGLSAGLEPIANYGMELSRGFKALKAWMSFKEHGIEKYAAMIRQNIAQAFYLGNLVENEPNLELVAPVSMNIVCFRFIDKHLTINELNELNKEILMQIQEEGIAAPSYTVLHGKYAIRAAITNHRSRKEDFEMMAKAVVRIGKNLLKK